MSRVCDVCGGEARYLVSVQVEILDLGSRRDRLKLVAIALCEGCEAESQQFLRQDAGQKGRLAAALCTHTPRPNPMRPWVARGVSAVSGD